MIQNIILASNSPRRREILANAGYKFKVQPSNYDEHITNLKYSKELVENCAYNKGLDVFEKNKESLVISADTVVVLDDTILGKPKDENDAFLTLKNLSDKTHFVATSVCLINKDKTLKDTAVTYVTFRKLENSEILDYIKTQKPLDKAGSYGIQDEGFDFATKINGELNNVIGFPLELFKKMLNLI